MGAKQACLYFQRWVILGNPVLYDRNEFFGLRHNLLRLSLGGDKRVIVINHVFCSLKCSIVGGRETSVCGPRTKEFGQFREIPLLLRPGQSSRKHTQPHSRKRLSSAGRVLRITRILLRNLRKCNLRKGVGYVARWMILHVLFSNPKHRDRHTSGVNMEQNAAARGSAQRGPGIEPRWAQQSSFAGLSSCGPA